MSGPRASSVATTMVTCHRQGQGRGRSTGTGKLVTTTRRANRSPTGDHRGSHDHADSPVMRAQRDHTGRQRKASKGHRDSFLYGARSIDKYLSKLGRNYARMRRLGVELEFSAPHRHASTKAKVRERVGSAGR
jgi:hypothetical protein